MAITQISNRLTKLEAQQPVGTGVWYALVRYFPPPGAGDWISPMIERLGWSSATFVLAVIDANDEGSAEPQEIIAPVHYDDMSNEDRTRYFAAGRDPGHWYLSVIGKGQPEAMPMFAGRAAFKADLIAATHQPQGGYFGGC